MPEFCEQFCDPVDRNYPDWHTLYVPAYCGRGDLQDVGPHVVGLEFAPNASRAVAIINLGSSVMHINNAWALLRATKSLSKEGLALSVWIASRPGQPSLA